MFDLDGSGVPVDCYNYEHTDANMLIEEFMLLSNFAVAQQIAVNLPEQALLRRHDEPLERRLVCNFWLQSLGTLLISILDCFR